MAGGRTLQLSSVIQLLPTHNTTLLPSLHMAGMRAHQCEVTALIAKRGCAVVIMWNSWNSTNAYITLFFGQTLPPFARFNFGGGVWERDLRTRLEQTAATVFALFCLFSCDRLP